jgi:GNAT superfamily N-acetyltransferase
MKLQSLGFRTDLIFPAFAGEIIDRGHYLVIKTPANPSFHFGNFLLFDSPPAEGDLSRWQNLFAKEIGRPGQVKHLAFGWDTRSDKAGLIQPFLDSGYHLDVSVVLTASPFELKPKSSPDFTIRQLRSEDDWQQSVENQVTTRETFYSEDGYRKFRQGQAERYRKMTTAGLGAWFGAFDGERLVGDLGIFVSEELGRYQSVQTHPDFRRRGIAGALVYQAGCYAFKNHDIERLVIVAEADSSPQRLYQSIGFQFTEYQMGIWKANE